MESMDASEPFSVNNNNHVNPQQHITSSQNKDGYNIIGSEEKMTAVHEEMNRMSKLPQNSTYVTHRMRVLNKIMQLLSIKMPISPTSNIYVCDLRTISQDEELELLFAGLSM